MLPLKRKNSKCLEYLLDLQASVWPGKRHSFRESLSLRNLALELNVRVGMLRYDNLWLYDTDKGNLPNNKR